jgi:hypothetical protein
MAKAMQVEALMLDNFEAETAEEKAQYLTNLRAFADKKYLVAEKSQKTSDYGIAAQWYQRALNESAILEKGELSYLYAQSLLKASQNHAALEAFQKSAFEYGAHSFQNDAAQNTLVILEQQHDDAAYLETAKKTLVALPNHPKWASIFQTTYEKTLKTQDITAIHSINTQVFQHQVRLDASLVKQAHQWQIQQSLEQQAYMQVLKQIAHMVQSVQLNKAEQQQVNQLKESVLLTLANDASTQDQRHHYLEAAAKAQGNAQFSIQVALERIETAFEANTTTAEPLVKAFIQDYPQHNANASLLARIAQGYETELQYIKAAQAWLTVGKFSTDLNIQKESLFTATDLYLKAGQTNKAITLLKSWHWSQKRYSFEKFKVQLKLAHLYEKNKDAKKSLFWFKQITQTVHLLPRADRKKHLATIAEILSLSYLKQAMAYYPQFKRIELNQPIQNTLNQKLKAFQVVQSLLQKSQSQPSQKHFFAARFLESQLYLDLALSIQNSERPEGLSELAMAEYEILLEDKLITYEDQALVLTEESIRMAQDSEHWGPWVARLYQQAAALYPSLYAKQEIEFNVYP